MSLFLHCYAICSFQKREARLVADQMRKFHEDEEKARLKRQQQLLREQELQSDRLRHIDQRRKALDEVKFGKIVSEQAHEICDFVDWRRNELVQLVVIL